MQDEIQQVVQSQEPEVEENIPPSRKNLVAVGLFFLGLILLLPLVFFINSNLKQSKKPETVKQSKRIFKPVAPYVSNQLIVRLKNSYTKDELERLNNKFRDLGVVSQEKAFKTNNPNANNTYLLKFKPETDIKKAGQELLDSGLIDNLEENNIYKIQEAPQDPYYRQLWGFEKIQMQEAWNLVKGSDSVVIGVLDTGIDYNHQDFAGRRIIRGEDFVNCNSITGTGPNDCASPKNPDNDPMDDHGHGTHVAGTIGAMVNNNIGVSGINWNVSLMAIKSMNRIGQGSKDNIIAGIYYAAEKRVNVLNMSIGGPPSCSVEYQRAVATAQNNGVIIVAAAGNSNRDAQGFSPASCNDVITVGNTTSTDARSGSSNFGVRVDLAAPGTDILSTMPNNTYAPKTGTSMAAPHVAGVVGLLLAAKPGLSRDQVLSCLVSGADPISTDRPIGKRLNAYRAITACTNLTPQPTASITPAVSPTSVLTSAPTQGLIEYEINGVIFLDSNGNRVRDMGEPGYTQAQVIIEGKANMAQNPNNSGNFSFNNLQEGTYTVSAIIGGVKKMTTPPYTLSRNARTLTVTFAVFPDLITQTPGKSPTPIIIIPSTAPTTRPIASSGPTPTPIQTYSCREDTSAAPALPGSIKIGTLICEPN